MGNTESNSASEPQIGKASEFYWACRDGNYQKVRTMIRDMNYEELNHLEPNGSTALHAATYNNHLDIVKLLLERGCARTILNRFGYTAYDEIKSEAMRALYRRPASERFVDENPSNSFGLSSNGKEDDDDDDDSTDDTPNNWLKGHTDEENAREATLMASIARAPLLMRKILRRRLEDECKECVKKLIDENTNAQDFYYRRLEDLLKRFQKQNSIDILLTIYTLETPIYRALQDDCESFTALIYLYLSRLQNRAYEGVTYRGSRMEQNDIQTYRWAFEHQNRVLETRTLQSMSKNKEKALEFAYNPQNPRPLAVLLIFNFRQECPTAIDLTKVSDDLPALSDFQDEEEVILLPFTLFKVREVKVDAHDESHYRITLDNVPVPKQSIMSSWLGML